MKRRGNVISPIDSINSIVEMLQQTDYTVEDGETVWVRSTQAMYVYRVNSGLVPDGANVIASLYGNGVWEKLNVSAAASLGPFNTVAAGAVGSGRLIDVDSTQIGLLTSGTRVWVISMLDFWRWDPLSTLTSDNATVVNPTANGVNPGRFIRELIAAAEWKQQATWHVSDATGTVDNDGLTSGTSITGLELGRRLGNNKGQINIQMTVNVHGTGVTNVNLTATVVGPGAIYFVGDRTVVASGTVSAATAINRAAPGTRATLTAAPVDFSTLVGQRVRISGGNANARLDERFVVDADLGASVARITRPLIPAANRFTGIIPNGGAGTLPVAGDTFDVYTTPTINGYIVITNAPYDGVTQNPSNALIIEDLNVGQTGPSRTMLISLTPSGSLWNFISLGIQRATFYGNVQGGVFTSVNAAGRMRLLGAQTDMYGGVFLPGSQLQLFPEAAVYLDFDIYLEQTASYNITINMPGPVAFYFGTVGFFGAGNGISLFDGVTYKNCTNNDTTHQLWGSVTGGGNVGINGLPGGKLYIDATTPTVTGPGGDFKIAGIATALTQVRATGVWTPGIACTWANWAANLYLVDPNTNSGIMRSA
jgi:hypothetical protein